MTKPTSGSGAGNDGDRSDHVSNNPASQSDRPSQASVEYLQSQRIAANFGNIVTILMQSPVHNAYPLKELHRIAVPAVVNNQFRLAEAHKKGSGFTVPVAIVLWARVSQSVAEKLSDTTQDHVLLEREDWTSGDDHWIVEVLGEDRFVGPLLQALLENELDGKTLKYRQRTKDGIEIKTLEKKNTSASRDSSESQ